MEQSIGPSSAAADTSVGPPSAEVHPPAASAVLFTPAPDGRPPIQAPCQISFVGIPPVEAAKIEVRAWLPRLGALTEGMLSGHVLIESVEEGRKERQYRVRMELVMTDAVVVVAHDHPSNAAHEDLYVAIRNAFRAARRQLEDYARG